MQDDSAPLPASVSKQSSFRVRFAPDGIARVYLLKHFPEASSEAQADLIELFKLMYNQGLSDHG